LGFDDCYEYARRVNPCYSAEIVGVIHRACGGHPATMTSVLEMLAKGVSR
jgi:hypothetical protein